ncbi:hypothetical protein JZ751_015507, partial [Albula glossodonta]
GCFGPADRLASLFCSSSLHQNAKPKSGFCEGMVSGVESATCHSPVVTLRCQSCSCAAGGAGGGAGAACSGFSDVFLTERAAASVTCF